MQVPQQNAEPDPEVKLLDCSQAPEVLALGNLSDAQLVDLLRSDPSNALYLIAFYHLHAGLVRALLASESQSEQLNYWIWFSAFQTLTNSQKKVIPVAGWLGRIVALSLIGREQPPVQGDLPIPLAWYLHQSLEMMPIPLRITAVMSEIVKSTDKEISKFFYLRQMPLSVIEVEQLRNESHRFFVDRIPVDVRRLYFGDPLDVESPIRLLPQLGVDVQTEIQHFERWHGVQMDASVPPIATASPGNDLKPNRKASKNSLGSVFVGLLLMAGGAAALIALVSGTQQSTVSPAPSALSIPATTLPAVSETTTTQTTSLGNTIPSTKPKSIASVQGTEVVSQATKTAVIPNVKQNSTATETTLAASPKPAKTSTETTVISTPKRIPNTATSTATTAISKPKLVPKASATSTPPGKPVIIAKEQLPLLDDALRTRPPRFFAVLIADPQRKNLASLRRFERGSYYRSLQGQPWIQVGAYNTLAKANAAMQEFKAKGFTVTLART